MKIVTAINFKSNHLKAIHAMFCIGSGRCVYYNNEPIANKMNRNAYHKFIGNRPADNGYFARGSNSVISNLLIYFKGEIPCQNVLIQHSYGGTNVAWDSRNSAKNEARSVHMEH